MFTGGLFSKVSSSSRFNETEFDREWEEKQRTEDAYKDYKRIRSYTSNAEEIDDQMRFEGYSKDEIDNASYEYNKGCYIATASFQGNIPYDALLNLKHWRYEVMEKSRFGSKLSNYYRKTAPNLAADVEKMPILCNFLRECFIKPSLLMVTKKRNIFRNILLYINFFCVLGFTTLFTKFKK